ncbi:MAG: hypothetical protein EAZ12_08205 [Sphingobacteriia bacterium]|nr:MAG: hypothetical protein EAZ12_08205 [Sphingobacteriia bacterium]
MKNAFFIIALVLALQTKAQTKSRFSTEINYGIQGNYFVRSYNEIGRPDGTAFLNKNFIGTIGGAEIIYRATNMASWGLAFSKSTNTRNVSYSTSINGVSVSIGDFDLKHENRFYQLFYQRKFSKKLPSLTYEIGLFYVRFQQQEVSIGNSVSFGQRNWKNSKLEEGGAFVGIKFEKYIDKKIALGIKSRVYYIVTADQLESITLTPTLTYHF